MVQFLLTTAAPGKPERSASVNAAEYGAESGSYVPPPIRKSPVVAAGDGDYFALDPNTSVSLGSWLYFAGTGLMHTSFCGLRLPGAPGVLANSTPLGSHHVV